MSIATATAHGGTAPAGVDVRAPALPDGAQILNPEALGFVAKLHRAFESRRQELFTRRAERQREFDSGELPDFIPETEQIRTKEWTMRRNCRR